MDVDPNNITNYDQTEHELQATLIFWILVAGKNAASTRKSLLKLHDLLPSKRSLPCVRILRYSSEKGEPALAGLMRSCGFGQFNQKARYLTELSRQVCEEDLDLFSCTLTDLMALPGVGPKTARAFLLHSRPKQRVAVLDTHVLKFLAEEGYSVPKTTPVGKRYDELEKVWLDICDERGWDLAEADLRIWMERRVSPNETTALVNI